MGRFPDYSIKEPQNSPNGKTAWHPLGVAWTREDGGINLQFNSHPIGRQVYLWPKSKEESDKDLPEGAQSDAFDDSTWGGEKEHD